MKPLHEELKQLREEQQITLKDIAKRTRIRFDFLERMETGDYSVAPMPFVRAFFREYAEVLEVDPARAMDKLDGKLDTILDPRPSHEPEPEPPASPKLELVTTESQPESGKSDEPDTELEETVTTDVDEPEPEEEPDIQQSLFDDNTSTDDDTVQEGSDEPAATDETPDMTDEAESEEDVKTQEEPEEEPSPETETDQIESEPDGEETPESDNTEPVAEDTVEPEPALKSEIDTNDSTLEIDLDENGTAQPAVRRPIELEEQKSFSNIIFAAIVIIMLIIAGIMIYLNRGDIF